MAFQTNVFRDGEWVTQTIDVRSVLNAQNTSSKPTGRRIAKPTRCGIITTTLANSPIFRHILPCRLRSVHHADVAFIADRTVHIREYCSEYGNFEDVMPAWDLGERIRNAHVIGSLPESLLLPLEQTPRFELDGEDVDMLDASAPPQSSRRRTAANGPQELPPQILLLVLESGTQVYAVIRTEQGLTTPFYWQSPPPNGRLPYFGSHIAVDPSSRFVAIASAQGFVVVYELISRYQMNQSFQQDEPRGIYKLVAARKVSGTFLKMDFLFPKENVDSFILLFIIHWGNSPRTFVFDWTLGEDVNRALNRENKGHRLASNKVPLQLIPLRFGPSFLVVYSEQILIFDNALVNPPAWNQQPIDQPEPSKFYIGQETPLWAAWVRPFRLFSTTKDWIYLAREDGVLVTLDVSYDEKPHVESEQLESLECSISGAFCALFDDFPSDVLVAACESGPGVVWKLVARNHHERALSRIPNWAPTIDFATVKESLRDRRSITARNSPAEGPSFMAPDRIFATSGMGVAGAIAEFRHGYQANIGIQLDCDVTTTHSWLLPVDTTSPECGYFLLMTLPDRSSILHISHDYCDLSEPDEPVAFDLSSRTFAVAEYRGITVQVTENYIVCTTGPNNSARVQINGQLLEDTESGISHVAIHQEFVLLAATEPNGSSRLYLCRIGADMELSLVLNLPVAGEVTCLAFGIWKETMYLFVGVWEDSLAKLGRFTLDPSQPEKSTPHEIQIPSCPGVEFSGAFVSVSAVELDGCCITVIGTRNGEVMILTVRDDDPTAAPSVRVEKFGRTPAMISTPSYDNRHIGLVCCDSALRVFPLVESRWNPQSFSRNLRVWPIDVQATERTDHTIPITSVTVLEPKFAQNAQNLPILLTAGSQIAMAEVLVKPKQVIWRIPLYATPTRVIYVRHIDSLIVSVSGKDWVTLRFLDPDTGKDKAVACEKGGDEPRPAVTGLGSSSQGDDILGLSQWNYEKSGHQWQFILVCTRKSGLVVLSADKQPITSGDQIFPIRYWTRYRKKSDEPIYSILGHSDGIIYCQGSTIRWEILNLEEKRLKPWKSFKMNSPALSLQVVWHHKLIAVTARDSVLILDPGSDESDEMTLEHADPRGRRATHSMEMSTDPTAKGPSMLLVSDATRCLTGLWVPWQQPGRNCEVVFEAVLGHSVRKMCQGHIRPGWLQEKRKLDYGALPMSPDGSSILGLSGDGSLRHFTLVGLECWAVLRLVHNLALAQGLVGVGAGDQEYIDEPIPMEDGGFQMQIDGDLLRWCREQQVLPKLFGERVHFDLLETLLWALDATMSGGAQSGQIWTRAGLVPPTKSGTMSTSRGTVYDEARERSACFRVVYDMMDYYLGPV